VPRCPRLPGDALAAGPDPVSPVLQQHWLVVPSGDTQGQRVPPFAWTELFDGSYRLKLPVNIYRAFAKALGAQPNFNCQTDIVAE